jgi:hypothetical protein
VCVCVCVCVCFPTFFVNMSCETLLDQSNLRALLCFSVLFSVFGISVRANLALGTKEPQWGGSQTSEQFACLLEMKSCSTCTDGFAFGCRTSGSFRIRFRCVWHSHNASGLSAEYRVWFSTSVATIVTGFSWFTQPSGQTLGVFP